MGSSLSCFKPPRDGAVRAVPERRRVSASELHRPASSFTASTSLTLEPRQRKSVEVERRTEMEKPVPEVEFDSVERLVPGREEAPEVGVIKIDGVETPREVSDEGSGTILEVDTPIAGSTMDDIGATDSATELVDMHVRVAKRLSESPNGSKEESVETRSRESSVEAEGASKISLPSKAPSLESMPPSLELMPASLKGAEEPVGERVRQDKGRLADAVRPSLVKGRRETKKLEFKRSDTMLDVRSSLPVRTHVTNYEKIEAEARVDPEEMVKSGKAKLVVASA